LDADYTWREVRFSLTGKSKEGGALSFEITKRETTVQSESLIKGEHGPLIWLHFRVSDTEELEESRKQLTVETSICEIAKHSHAWPLVITYGHIDEGLREGANC
jgi:hypothetical protein